MNLNLAKFISLAFMVAVGSAEAGTCEENGSIASEIPTGKEYPAVDESFTYSHYGDWNYQGEEATFMSSTGHFGVASYSYGNFKWKAKDTIAFSAKGPQWVIAIDPVSGFYYCNNVSVQSRPTISKQSFSNTSRTASVNFTVDRYSKAYVQNQSVVITFQYRSDFYGNTGTAATVNKTGLSGTASATLMLPDGDNLYEISARVFDGTYSQEIPMGWIRVTGAPNPPCQNCNKL